MTEPLKPWPPLRVTTLLQVCIEIVLGTAAVISGLNDNSNTPGGDMALGFAVILRILLVVFTVPALVLALATRGNFLVLAFILSLLPIVAIIALFWRIL